MRNAERKAAYYPAALLCFVFLALPLLWFEVPPLADYPNHLARVHILANYQADAFLSRTFRPIVEPLPNLAIDMAATPLARWFGTFAASKIFLAGILFAYCCGCAALGAVGSGRPNWLAIACFLTFYSSAFLWGFVNYVAGVAVFLLAFAWWLHSIANPRRARWIVTAILGLLSYLCHLTAYGFLCVGAVVVVALRLRSRAMNWRRAFAAVAPLLPAAFLYQYVRLSGERTDTLHLAWNSPVEKIPALLNLVRTYDTAFDATLLAALLLTALAALWKLRPIRIHPEFGAVSAAFFVLFLAAPRELFARSASGLDVRFVVPAAVLLLLGLRFEAGGAVRRALWATLVLLLAIRVGFIWLSWQALQGNVKAFNSVMQQLPRESSTCVMHPIRPGIDESKRDVALSHFYCLAIIERGAVTPLLFTDPGAQPIEFRVPPPAAVRAGYSMDAQALRDPAVWDYCDSFVTYREPPAAGSALQGRAEVAWEAPPYRLWWNRRSERAGTPP